VLQHSFRQASAGHDGPEDHEMKEEQSPSLVILRILQSTTLPQPGKDNQSIARSIGPIPISSWTDRRSRKLHRNSLAASDFSLPPPGTLRPGQHKKTNKESQRYGFVPRARRVNNAKGKRHLTSTILMHVA
jgi:hypothetical protein